MALERVCALSDLPADSVMEVVVRGEPYALCNVKGRITALHGICPHAGGPLGQGQISREGRVICPYHMWEFDCATGEHAFAAAPAVPTYPVEVRGEDVLADLP